MPCQVEQTQGVHFHELALVSVSGWLELKDAALQTAIHRVSRL